MAALTVSNYLGMLQDDPDDAESFASLREALDSGDRERIGEAPLRLLEAARHGHERRGELQAVAWLIELEADFLSEDDPTFRGALYKELGRLRHEELLDDAGALEAYGRARELRSGDSEVETAIEEIEQAAEKWRQIADRFIEEAADASDATLKTSMLTRAAGLVWQYRQKGKARETDKLFKQALKADPASTRAARLYCLTLRARNRFKDVARVLATTAEAARSRDDKLNLFIQAARVYLRQLDDRDQAAGAYRRVLDFAPGHEEALRFLVEYFTEREQWDDLVALYEDALRSRQKLESEQGILLQIGMVHWRIRNAPTEAEAYFARLRKIDPAHPGMLSFYRDFLGQSEDEEARARLLTILTDAQRVAETDEQKRDLAIELARAAQATDATERAIDAWKAVQRLDPASEEANAALRELYRRGQKWNALVELMRSELDALPANSDDATVRERRVALLRELIGIYRDELQLDVMVIHTYKALLEEVPGDREALAELAKTYEGMGRWNDLIHVLEDQVEVEEDVDRKVALLNRVASLWIDRFANYNQATKPFEAIVELEPENREALGKLKTIYTKKRAWRSLFGVLEKESRLASDPEARLATKVELARLAGDRLHRNADAIRLWREILETAPDTEGGLDTLEKLADREKDWETLAFALELRASRSEDAEARIGVLQKLGTVYGERIGDQAKAAAVWKRVLALDPKNGRALRTLREAFLKGRDWESLESLYAEAGDWEGLVDVLGTAAEKTDDGGVRVELSFRAAAIYEEKLGNPERAFRSYERVLSVDPTNERAARALTKIYEQQEKWPRLAKMHEILYEALGDDAGLDERLAALATLRDLYLDKLRDEAGAFRWASEAFRLAPEDEEVRAQLEAAAERAGKHEELANLFRARLEAEGLSPQEQTALRRRLAGLAGEQLGQTDEAIAQLEQILERDPTDEEAIEVLDRLYRSEGRTQELRALLVHRLEHGEMDPDRRRAILIELAHLEEEELGDADAAAERYRAALAIDATDEEALCALDRLAFAGERWGELADVLRRRIERASGGEERELTVRLADLLRTKLDDPDGALDAYARVLEGDPSRVEAIAGLEELAAIDACRQGAAVHLERVYELNGEYEKLASILRRRLEATDDEEERRELRLRLAEIAGALGDAEGAYEALEAAFLDRPGDVELWDRVAAAAEAAGKHEDLAAAFATAIEAGDLSEHDAAALAARAAEIYDVVLGRPGDAEPFHKRVLHHDPLHGASFLALKELYTEQERWDELQVLYRNRIAETVDAEQKLELLLQVCFLFEEILENSELAIRSYQEVLELAPEHAGSRRALDRLYRRTERWRDLVALLRQELDRADSDHEAIELLYEIGELHEQKLAEAAAAVDQYEAVLDKSPTHVRAQQALERLLSEPSQRQRIAALLEPLYDTQGAWNELANVLEVQLEDVADPGGRVGLLTRLANLYEDRLHDVDRAFAALSQAVLTDPADAELRRELARLATLRGAERERAELLERAVAEAEGSAYLQAELLLELARLWDEQLGELARAEGAYARLIDVDGDNPDSVLPAARALERIHLAAGEYEKLAQDLRLQIRLEHEPEARADLLLRLARLLEDTLEDVRGAIVAHRERLDLDPADADALRSLERLYERTGEWQRLIGVLQARDAATTEESEQAKIALRIGEIYESKLDDADNAIVAYNDALSRFGPSAPVLEALARLYEASEKWDDLLEILELQIDQTEVPEELATLRFRSGELMRRTGDLERAIETYGQVLSLAPGHPGAVAALEEITTDPTAAFRVEAARTLVPHYEASQRYGDLVGVLEVVAETDDPLERLRALRRAADIADVGLQDPGVAFALTAKATRAALHEPDLGQLLDELERHATAADKHAEHAELLEELAPDIMDGDLQVEVWMKAATVARTRLADRERARRLFGRVLDTQPDHGPALDALEDLLLEAEDYEALLGVLRRKTEVTSSIDERVVLLERQARICEDRTGDLGSAIDAYEQVLGEREDRQEAYEALARLYAKAERWPDLAATLERQLEAGVGNSVEVRHALAKVCFERLGDAYQALDHLRDALSADRDHEPSIVLLEVLMEQEEHRGRAAEILEPVFLARMDWPKVTATLEARLASTDDPETRKQLLRKLGQIHEDYLQDLEGALDTYARLFREDPRDRDVWATLSRLANVLESWKTLGDTYAGVVTDRGVMDEDMADLARTAGRIFDERVGDPERSSALYGLVLEFDPADTEAFRSLESAYERLGHYSALADLYRSRVDVLDSDEERVGTLHKLARTQETKNGDREAAIETYREILRYAPDDTEAVAALDRLLTAEGRWVELTDHLRFQIDASLGTDRELDLKHRLAGILAERLDEQVGALDVLEEAVQSRPDHGPSVKALEALGREPELRLRVTQILEPIYRAADDWQKLVEVLEAQVALTDYPSDRARLLAEIGRLYEERGGDGARAFDAWARALAADPQDDLARAELDRLAQVLGAWDEHVAAYEQAIAAAQDSSRVSELLGVIARIHDEKRGDPRAAIQTYERLLENDPDDASALDALEALHTMVGDWRGLVDLLDRKVERSYEPTERAQLLRRAGSVLEELLGDPAGAIDLYRRASQEDDTDVVALEALDRLYSTAGDFEALADVLRRRLELEEPNERAEIGLRLGQLLETQLGEPDRAIDAFVSVLDAHPSHPEAVKSLSRLYERQGLWPELLDNLKLQAGLAESVEERVQLIFRAGEVTERELDDTLEALDYYEQALALDSRHEPSLQALIRISHLEDYRMQAADVLEPLLTVQERWDLLADLLRLKAETATDPQEKKEQFVALARVCESGLGDREGAFEAMALALTEDPAEEEVAEELERLAAATDRYDRLADEFAARAQQTLDPVVARGHYLRLARIAEERLADDVRAVEAFERALEQSGDDEDLLAALDRLHTKMEAWDPLGQVLERRVQLAVDPVERADLLVRLGTLREEQFGDLQGAFAAYQEVVERDPADSRALDGLERLGRHEDLALQVVDTLEAAYRETGALERIASLYDIRIQLADSEGERVRMLQEAAALWENDLGQPGKALEVLCKALQLDPRDAALLEDIERLASTSGRWEALRGLVESAVESEDLDRDLRRDLNLRAASWYRDHLQDAAAADSRLRAALEADPESAEAHERLVELLREPGREADLVAALRQWAAVEYDSDVKKRRLREAARLAEAALGDTATAADCYEAILAEDPSDPQTLDDLVRLRREEARWVDVVPLLERRVEVEVEPHRRLELRRDLASIFAGPLDDPERATSAFEAILEEEPEDIDAIAALEELYEKAERWDDLRCLLDRRLDIASTDDERIAARVRLARLSERAFDRREDAMEQLQEVLELDPTNVEALDELERLLGLEERWDALAELLDRRSSDAAALGNVERQKAFLARLAVLHEEKRGASDEALAVLDRILTLDPTNVDALGRRLALHEAAESWADVAQDLERLLPLQEIPEAVATCHRIAGIAEEKLQDPARAAGALRAAYELQPGATTRELLKTHYEQHENWRELAELLEAEAEEETAPAAKVEALKSIANLYMERLGDAATGAVCLERAAELAPDDREVLLPLCDLYIAAGRQQDAVPVLEKIIESFGKRRSKELAQFHHRLGRALEGMGDFGGAREHYDAAFKIDLTNVQILRDLGRLCHSQGDWARAQKTFRALLLQKLGPDAGITKADVYFYLGDISAKTDDKRKAISMLERAVAEDPSHAEAAALLAELKS